MHQIARILDSTGSVHMSHAQLDGEYDACIVWPSNATLQPSRSISRSCAARTWVRMLNVLVTRFGARDTLDLVGLPRTLVVNDGSPNLERRYVEMRRADERGRETSPGAIPGSFGVVAPSRFELPLPP